MDRWVQEVFFNGVEGFFPIFIPHLRFSFYQYMENGQVKVSLAMKRLMYYNLPKKALLFSSY